MSGLKRRGLLAGLSSAVVALLAVMPANVFAQTAGKTTITFAGVTFSEAGRGDKLRAWVDKFNKSQDKIQVETLGLPFATFANTMFTQMGGGGGMTAAGVKG
jgi:multiple sugar transport system substrate-binding protein